MQALEHIGVAQPPNSHHLRAPVPQNNLKVVAKDQIPNMSYVPKILNQYAPGISETANLKDITPIATYMRGQLLGKGGFAECYEVQQIPQGSNFAAKIIDKKTMQKKTRMKLKTEIEIHQSLSHPYIVHFLKTFQDKNNYYIILELCHCKTLHQLLKVKKRFTEEEATYFLLQILCAVKHMHQNKVIHRDLKLGNLFLSESMDIKIGDFGLAAKLDNDEERKKTICGTPNYIAPEIISPQHKEHGHSYEVDVWSIGVILFTMLVGKPPFETKDVKTTYSKIQKCAYSFPPEVPVTESAKNLIQQILQNDPAMRPSIDEIVKHPFIQNNVTFQTPASLIDYAKKCCNISVSSNKDYSFLKSYYEKTIFQVPKNRLAPSVAAAVASSATLVSQTAAFGGIGGNMKRLPLATIDDNVMQTNFKGKSPQKLPIHVRGQSSPLLSTQNKDTKLPNTLTFTTNSQGFLARTGSENIDLQNINFNGDIAMGGMDCAEPEYPPSKPKSWVTQWSDLTNRYGLAYRLNCGCIGAHFNDFTKIIYNPKSGQVKYLERVSKPPASVDEMHFYTIDNYPEHMNKKITLIKYFKSILDNENQTLAAKTYNCTDDMDEKVYVKRWLRTKHAAIFRLSNKNVQVTFNDSTEIILTEESQYVTYKDKEGDRKTYSLKSVLNDKRPDILKRLKFTKDVLNQLVSNKK